MELPEKGESDRRGRAALQAAVEQNQADVVRALLKGGADTGGEVGVAVRLWAVDNGHSDIMGMIDGG